MTIKYFGIAGEIMAKHPDFSPKNYTTVAELKNGLLDNCREFNSIKGFMVAINHEYATNDQSIAHGDEVAIIPPVSGG